MIALPVSELHTGVIGSGSLVCMENCYQNAEENTVQLKTWSFYKGFKVRLKLFIQLFCNFFKFRNC